MNKKERDKILNDSIRDGVTDSAGGGITGTFKIPFALALGATNAEIGLLTAIPHIFMVLAQPFIGKLVDRFQNRKMLTIILCNVNP